MSVGVFICPEGTIRSRILFWKDKIHKELKFQPYLTHPPHMTLINIDLDDQKRAIVSLKKYLKDMKSFYLNINKKNIFWDDSITNGHTIYYEIEKNSQLQNIQIAVATFLAEFKIQKNLPNFLIGNKLLENSFDLYGFPFVGDHWIPHFTIASLKVNKGHPLIKEFLSHKELFSFKVNTISLWQINNDDHNMVEEINLR